jgi:transposase
MCYSLDLRKRAVSYVRQGGGKAEAARLFGVGRRTLYHWLGAEDLTPKAHGSRKRKLCKAALEAHVRDCPDALLRERAQHFGVSHQSVWSALRSLNIRKKNDEIF